MVSYHANFASHRTFDRLAGFLSTWGGIEKYKKCTATFYVVSTTIPKLDLSDKNIGTHIRLKF